MLLRRTHDGIIAITQPYHAWIAGELARSWGGAFEVPRPRDAIVRSAALHDIGWLEWDADPQVDSDTGMPLEFMDVPAEAHTDLWRKGVQHALIYGLPTALHVSRHGDAIYERTFDAGSAKPEAAAAVRRFLDEQHVFQGAVVACLAKSPETAEFVAEAILEFAKRFIAAVDTLSLNLCWGIDRPVEIDDVPQTATTSVALTLTADGPDIVLVHPWPFASPEVVVTIEGRRTDAPSFLEGAPWGLSLALRPKF